MQIVIIFGPPAVGKMTVGYELERLTGLRLFHNHMTIELVLRFFDFGTPPFARLVNDFRARIFEEVASSNLSGLIFTYVWDLDAAEDKAFMDRMSELFHAHGADVYYVELAATLEERIGRNETEFRLKEKPSKRNIERSRRNLLDQRYRLNTNGDFFYPEQHLRIDNTALTPEQVARQIMVRFNLPDRS